MDYDLLQRHGVTNIERKHSALDDVGGIGIYSLQPNAFTLTFELDGAGLDRLEHALRLLEEQDVIAADEGGPYGVSCWDAACDEVGNYDEDIHEEGDCVSNDFSDNDLTTLKPIGCNNNDLTTRPGDDIGDVECFEDLEEDKAPSIMPAHHKYILKYR